MNSALKLKNAELATLADSCDDAKLRDVAIAAALEAVALTHVEASQINDAKTAASQGIYGDDALTASLSSLADTIEAPYVKALDNAVDVSADERLMGLFRQSRAVTALYLALNADVRAQAGNALYEALYAGVEPDTIKSLFIA